MSTQYEAAAREAADKPVTFTLCGKKFSTKVEVDGFVAMDLSKAFAEEMDRGEDEDPDEEAGMRALVMWGEFFEGVLTASELRRFKTVCRRNSVQLRTIVEIARDIMPLLFGFPTTPSSSSAASPEATGRTSTDGVSSAEPAALTG